MYTFRNNWDGTEYEYPTLREAKREAQKHTYGFCIYIHKGYDIVAVIEPKDKPLP